MEPNVTTGLISPSMANTATELDDFDNVVHLYWRRVHRFLLTSVRDPELAENLTQDCFLKAYKGRNRFRGESSVQSWLMRIAVNLLRDVARNRRLQFWKRVRTSAIDEHAISDWIPDRDLSPEAKALVSERIAAIWRATESLSERQRTVFLLRFVEDMDILEIAAATGLKEGAVKVHLFRALHAVRNRIGKEK